MAKPTRRVPYSSNSADLLYPGRAMDFFDPAFGDIPSDAALCSEMARLAYLRHEDPGGVARLQTFLGRPGFTLRRPIDTQDTQGFVASRGDVTVIAFRGTEPDRPGDMRQDARFWSTQWRGRGRVHKGFSEALEVVHDEVLAAAAGGGRLLLTGHSLGAALALLASGLLPPARHQQTTLYTFGCPRAGDEEFVASVAAVRHERYAGVCDLVTWVPPRSIVSPYSHHGTLYCIDRAGAVHPFGAGEAGHDQAAALRASCSLSPSSIFEVFHLLVGRQVPAAELSDHAPINYTSGVWGLR